MARPSCLPSPAHPPVPSAAEKSKIHASKPRRVCKLAIVGVLLLLVPVMPAQADDPAHGFKALIFSKTEGFRHSSIPDGIAAIQALAVQHDFDVDATEDATAFTEANLAQYDVVIFLNTTGDVLNAEQEAAFEAFIRAGGGFVGIHSAADTEYDWSFYGGLVGAYFASHPEIQDATVTVLDGAHPSSSALPERWDRRDEWYNFRDNPRGRVHVLATIEESTYSPGDGAMGTDHPIAWCHPYQGGRSWYTAGGHREEAFDEPLFRDHLLGGIEWAAGAIEGDCGGTIEASYAHVVLDEDVVSPMELAVAPDGRVFVVELGGTVKVYLPGEERTQVAASFDVFAQNEHGLLGVALDPSFADNNWIYLFYSPAGETVQRVSRFTVSGNTLDRASEEILLTFPTDRDVCCHAGGSLAFGPDGDLFISTGDDTNPFDSDGYAPIDERPGRQPWDAQRSSGNTDDLRGKVLRITPEDDGTYAIPDGNLFPSDGTAGRPEIYVMGTRNPFRIAVDQGRGWLYWGDVGPDAGSASSARGPQGYDEFNQARGPGNFGWPYCSGDNEAYRDYNFSTNSSGPAFNCAAPVNDSPNNTGASTLPAAEPAWIWYPYGPSTAFPALPNGGGRTAMAGPTYLYDPDLDSEVELPAYFDRSVFIYEWSRSWIRQAVLDDDGDLLAIVPFATSLALRRPIDLELGPDGALYMLEWGTGFGTGNDDARLSRLEYRPSGRAPVAVAQADPPSGPLPLTVLFSAEQSFDPDVGSALTYAWDIDDDGTVDAEGVTTTYTYTEAGVYTARLVVTDSDGETGRATVQVVAGNTEPALTFEAPAEGGFFDWGDQVRFEVRADDAEDGTTANGSISCSALTVQPLIGHDDHGHPLEDYNACEAVVQTADGHGGDGDNVFYVFEASYTDEGAAGVGNLTARRTRVIRPKRLEAEHFDTNGGVQVENTGDVLGGNENIGFIGHGEYIGFDPVNLTGIDFVTYRVASAGVGGRIEARAGGPDGTLLSTAHVEPTGEWQVYRDVTVPIEDPGDTFGLFLVFKNQPGDDGLFNVNYLTFHGQGVAEPDDRGTEGLTATYYDSADLSGTGAEQVDPQINFNWAGDAPHDGVGADNFSVRWEGSLVPEVDGLHGLHARSDDGMRVWLDGEMLLDQWVDQPVTEVGTQKLLEAGRAYALRVEYYDGGGQAQAHLLWTPPGVPKQTVPARVLYPQGVAIPTEPEGALPATLALEPVAPNPAAGRIRLVYHLPSEGPVRLDVFDVLGRRVAVVDDARRPAGTHEAWLDGSTLASGTYLCRLTAGGRQQTQSFVVVR